CAEDPHFAATSFVDHAEAARYFRRHGGRTRDRFGAPQRGRFRVTEHAPRRAGLNPHSHLNPIRAAPAGKASLPGHPLPPPLQHPLPIWAFDPVAARGSLIVEIYTSIAALDAGRPKGRTKMTTIEALNAALASAAIASLPVPGAGRIDDHKSDALLTAAWLR